MIGKTLAHYEIIDLLGKGGMGEVYRAHDTKLDRDVAVKVLPGDLSDDPERVARFKREARTLASLHHPHIASIFGLEEVAKERLLVMELVEGEDLGQRLQRGPVPVDEALDIAHQIAEGLEAAHEKGIVHRDLKPANVKVTPGGKVKILDFGLARAYGGDAEDAGGLDEHSPTITAAMTRAGTILGTAAYMSPEQARGKHVDKRTDVWAFGCVLYEILVGRRCFDGDNVTDVLSAVVKETPDWSLLPAHLPWRARDLLQRALQKDPRKRLRDMGDVALALELAAAEAATGAPALTRGGAPASGPASRRWIWLVIGLTVGAAAVAMLTRPWSNEPALRNPLADATIRKITDFPGDELKATLSPDGRFVAFASDRNGDFDLVVGQVGTRDFRNVKSTDRVITTPVVRTYGFTGDGAEIWMSNIEGRIRKTSLLGGPWHDFLAEEARSVDWSPDGSRLVYRNASGGDPLFIADRDGANAKLILDAPEGYHQHFPTWSSDGAWIYLVRGWRPTESNLWRVRPDGSGLEQLTEDLHGIASLAPIDVRTVLLSATDRDGGGPWLWMYDAKTGATQRVSFGVEKYTSVAASKDGRRVVAAVENPQVILWRVPILDRIATEADAVPYPVPAVHARYPRFGQSGLFYLSALGSTDGLWKYQDGEATEVWRGSGVAVLDEAPEVSPTGDMVAFVLRENDHRHILILSANGAERRVLPTGSVDLRGGVAWSPDSHWIAAGGIEAGAAGLFKFPVDGGPPVRLAHGEAAYPVWSPLGNLIVYAGPLVGGEAPLLAVRSDGTAFDLPEIRVQGGIGARFLPNGRALVYMQGLTRLQDFYLLDLASMRSRRLTRLEDPAEMTTFDIAPDGTEIVFDRRKENSDVVLIELGGGASE